MSQSDEFLQLQHQSTDTLLQTALTASDEEYNAGWVAIGILQERATRDVFEAARAWCSSDEPSKRVTAATILAQLGLPDRTYLDETLDIFFGMLESETDTAVLNAVTVGLGHIMHEPRKIQPLLKFKNYPDPDVRFGVAFGLCCEDDPLAIAALIELSSDEDDTTRDWATFGLGSLTGVDTPAIRDALIARFIDPDDKSDAPYEALTGLCNRHDHRAFEYTLSFLEAGRLSPVTFEAAETLADPRLYAALVNLRTNPDLTDYERGCLESAIAACQSE